MSAMSVPGFDGVAIQLLLSLIRVKPETFVCKWVFRGGKIQFAGQFVRPFDALGSICSYKCSI